MAIMVDFFLQITAFVVCLSFDAQRREAGVLDLCCASYVGGAQTNRFLCQTRSSGDAVQFEDEANVNDCKENDDDLREGKGKVTKPTGTLVLQTVPGAMSSFANLMLKSPAHKAGVLLLLGGLMAMLATGIPKLDFGLDFAAFILDDSYVANYIQSTREADFYSGSDLSQRSEVRVWVCVHVWV